MGVFIHEVHLNIKFTLLSISITAKDGLLLFIHFFGIHPAWYRQV